MRRTLKKNGLFLRLLGVILGGVILVTAVTSMISIYTAEKLYLESFCRNSALMLEQQEERFDDLNNQILQFANTMNQSWALRLYLTTLDLTTREASNTIFSLNRHIKSAGNSDFIASINYLMVGMNGRYVIGNGATLLEKPEDILSGTLAQKAFESPQRLVYDYLDSGYTNFSNSSGLYAAAKLLIFNKTEVPYGCLFIFIPDSMIAELFRTPASDINVAQLIRADGKIISSANATGEFVQKDLVNGIHEAKNSGELYFPCRIDGVEMAIVSHYVASMDLYIVNYINSAKVNETTLALTIIAAAAAVCLLVSIVALFIIKRTTHPIYALIDNMTNAVSDNFRKPITLHGSSEVQDLEDAYNNMLILINTHIEQLKNAEKQKRSAELHALQMQINPHFIYNTLTAVKWLVWQGDKEKSVATINSFITLLQNTISNKKEMITVAEEAENIRNYMYLQHIRFGDDIVTEIITSGDCGQCKLPKLIVQPFVENAFFHAFCNKKEGFIFVNFRRKGDSLIIEIADNGDGMTEVQAQNILKSKVSDKSHFTGIGVCNVNDRLRLLYGDNGSVKCTSTLNGGTTFTITIPASNTNASLT